MMSLVSDLLYDGRRRKKTFSQLVKTPDRSVQGIHGPVAVFTADMNHKC